MTTQKTSQFYWACRNGDIGTVKEILPKLKLIDINRVESNGSTALHASSYYGHANIVRLLLQQGADTNIRNKYDKTAKEEASTDEVRVAFESSKEVKAAGDDDDADDDIPQSELVTLYPNSEDKDKSHLATNILKARLGTHQAHQYTITAASNLEHLEKQYRKQCEATGKTKELHTGEKCFRKYRETGDFGHIIHLITNDTPFYEIIREDETFFIEICKHLLAYDKYRFQGHTYTTPYVSREEFKVYEWALQHPKSLLEIRRMTETFGRKKSAYQYCTGQSDVSDSPQRVLFDFEFVKECFTALDVHSLSLYSEEKEVHILPGTFFEVTQIRKDNRGVTIISLNNVPINNDVLLTVT